MGELDWHKVRFLESATNLKPLLRTLTGRTPSTTLAREIGACLQQGRFYYDAAAHAPLEIRPLLLYYGLVAFAKAVVAGRTTRSLSTLAHSHGLSDTSLQGSVMRDLRVRIGTTGTFQDFNDVVRNFSRVLYFEANTKPAALGLPSATSGELQGREWDLRAILSRIPGLEDLYRVTFSEEANTEGMSISFWAENGDFCELRLDDREGFADRQELQSLVSKWRTRYPFLSQWRFVSGVPAWDKTVLNFANVSNAGLDEFSEAELMPLDAGFGMTSDARGARSVPRTPLRSILVPMAGGFPEGHPHAMAPLDGVYPSEFALHYLMLFILASVVRYRPDTWAHAISRSVLSDRPSDDQVIAILERFLEIHTSTVVGLVVTALNPHEDRYL